MARRRRYSPEEIERGLTALILAGSSREAAEATGINASTLREWKADHPDQYARLQQDLEPRIVQKIAAEAEGIVVRLANIQHTVLDQFEQSAHELKPAELAAASRNLATTSALYVDKHSSPLRERPSHVQQGSDVEGLMMRMARLLGHEAPKHVENQAITSTAQALPE
jgi:transposase-like protein